MESDCWVDPPFDNFGFVPSGSRFQQIPVEWLFSTDRAFTDDIPVHARAAIRGGYSVGNVAHTEFAHENKNLANRLWSQVSSFR